MEYEIRKRPSYSILDVTLDAGETVNADPGAMVSRSETMQADTNVGGDDGIGGMVKKAVSSTQSLVSNEFTANADGANVVLAPDHPGDVFEFDLAETGRIKCQSGTTLMWTEDVTKEGAMNEVGNLFSGGDLRVLAMEGAGKAFLSAFGSVYSVDVSPDDPAIVDEDHIVAWTDSLSLSRQRDGNLKSSVLGGEGLVTKFTGNGSVWLQTRDPMVFRNAGGGGGDEGDGADLSDIASDFI